MEEREEVKQNLANSVVVIIVVSLNKYSFSLPIELIFLSDLSCGVGYRHVHIGLGAMVWKYSAITFRLFFPVS